MSKRHLLSLLLRFQGLQLCFAEEIIVAGDAMGDAMGDAVGEEGAVEDETVGVAEGGIATVKVLRLFSLVS